MPALTNIRQERFCQLVKRGVPPFRAYPMAGYNPHPGSPYRLRDNARVKRRIAEITRGIAMKTRITVETLIADLAEDRELARSLEQPSAAISATQLTARLLGLLVERKESGDPGAFAGMQSEAQVLALVKAELGEEAALTLTQALQKADEQPDDRAAAPDPLPPLEPGPGPLDTLN